MVVNVSLQAVRQEHIRGLIKGNSVAKTELKHLHNVVRVFACLNLLHLAVKLTLFGTKIHEHI